MNTIECSTVNNPKKYSVFRGIQFHHQIECLQRTKLGLLVTLACGCVYLVRRSSANRWYRKFIGVNTCPHIIRAKNRRQGDGQM